MAEDCQTVIARIGQSKPFMGVSYTDVEFLIIRGVERLTNCCQAITADSCPVVQNMKAKRITSVQDFDPDYEGVLGRMYAVLNTVFEKRLEKHADDAAVQDILVIFPQKCNLSRMMELLVFPAQPLSAGTDFLPERDGR